jgi:hypothetical protein
MVTECVSRRRLVTETETDDALRQRRPHISVVSHLHSLQAVAIETEITWSTSTARPLWRAENSAALNRKRLRLIALEPPTLQPLHRPRRPQPLPRRVLPPISIPTFQRNCQLVEMCHSLRPETRARWLLLLPTTITTLKRTDGFSTTMECRWRRLMETK